MSNSKEYDKARGEAAGQVYVVGAIMFSIAFGFYVDTSGIASSFMMLGSLLMAGAIFSSYR